MFHRQYSYSVTQVFMPYRNNAECTCIDTQNKQWQNVGGGMSQAEVTSLSDILLLNISTAIPQSQSSSDTNNSYVGGIL